MFEDNILYWSTTSSQCAGRRGSAAKRPTREQCFCVRVLSWADNGAFLVHCTYNCIFIVSLVSLQHIWHYTVQYTVLDCNNEISICTVIIIKQSLIKIGNKVFVVNRKQPVRSGGTRGYGHCLVASKSNWNCWLNGPEGHNDSWSMSPNQLNWTVASVVFVWRTFGARVEWSLNQSRAIGLSW